MTTATQLGREREAVNCWDKFLERVKSRVSINTFTTWFQPTRFNRAEGDILAVDQIDAIEALGGNEAFTFVGVVDFQNNFFTGAGQIGFFTTATDTFILINTRVDSGPIDFEEATIRLSGVHNVDDGFFVL